MPIVRVYWVVYTAYNNFVFVLTYFWLKLILDGTSRTSSRVSMSRRSLINGTPSIFCHMTKNIIFKKITNVNFRKTSIQTCIHIPDKQATGIWRPRHDPCSHYTSLQYLYHMTITWPDKLHIHPLVHMCFYSALTYPVLWRCQPAVTETSHWSPVHVVGSHKNDRSTVLTRPPFPPNM